MAKKTIRPKRTATDPARTPALLAGKARKQAAKPGKALAGKAQVGKARTSKAGTGKASARKRQDAAEKTVSTTN